MSIFSFGQAPTLKRKASLGIALEPLSDSIAKANNLTEISGVYIPQVWPNSTAANLGIEPGDILVGINDQNIRSNQDVFSAISDLRAEDLVTLRYYHKGKLKNEKGKAIPRPIENSDFGEVHYDQVSYNGNRLRSILHLPHGVANPPVIFYIQGYTCQSVEFSMAPDHTVKKLIDDWVKAGFAVYRVEKPGIGDSDCEKGCYELNFREEIETFRQGYMTLQKDLRIDSNNIFLFGHSIGGIIAPVVAAEFQPRGVITYGTLINSWFEYMQELTRVQGEMFRLPYPEIERDIRNATPFWYALLVAKKTPEEILGQKEFYDLLESEGTLETFRAGQFMQRHYTYWSDIQEIELVNEWLEVESKVLALYGEFDIQALNANHIYTIARAVNTNHPGNAEAKIIKGADHGFVRFSTMDENVNTINSNNYGPYLRENYHNGIATTTISWIKKNVD
jgi:hypothetical protein